jgi:hypothetical protein
MALENRAGLAMYSASSRPGRDVSCGSEALDIAQVSSKPQATSLETLEHIRLPSLSVSPQWKSRIAAARSVPIEDEAARRGLKLKRCGRHGWVGPCPVHGGRDRFSINTRKQVFNCRGDEGGDVIDLVQHLDGCDFNTAVETLVGRPPTPSPPPQPTPAGNDNGGRALRIWDEAVDLGGTLAAVYLASRKLVVPETVSGRALRFHPACRWRDDDESPLIRVPALIGLYRDVASDQPKAILRCALTPDGRKRGRKAYGPKAGCAIKLTADEDVEQGLHVGEGVETTLAGMMLGFTPAWALGDTGNMKSFGPLPGIEALTIFVDRDRAGQEAARECSILWSAAGREVWHVIPDVAGEDMNDVIAGGGQ